jgi:hypothetical protein
VVGESVKNDNAINDLENFFENKKNIKKFKLDPIIKNN